MFDLKCKRQGCKFNKSCNCTAHGINVGRETECKTYEDCGVKKKENDGHQGAGRTVYRAHLQALSRASDARRGLARV